MTWHKFFLCSILMALGMLFVLERYDLLNFREEPVEIVPTVAQQPLSRIGEDTIKEVNDLLKIVYALERYKLDYRRYPISSNYGVGWDGALSSYGESREDWIRELVPKYIDVLPRDPRMLSDGRRQYIYRSNGANYKLIVHGAFNCQLVKNTYPFLVDPVRDCFSYGFWTEGGARL